MLPNKSLSPEFGFAGNGVNFWSPADKPKKIFIYCHGGVEGRSKLGLVPFDFVPFLRTQMDLGLPIEAELQVISSGGFMIKCHLVTREEENQRCQENQRCRTPKWLFGVIVMVIALVFLGVLVVASFAKTFPGLFGWHHSLLCATPTNMIKFTHRSVLQLENAWAFLSRSVHFARMTTAG